MYDVCVSQKTNAQARPPSASTGRRWNVAAAFVAIITAAVVTLLPVASRGRESAVTNPDGTSVVESTESKTSLLSSEGSVVLIIALIPAAVVAMPLIARTPKVERRTRVASIVVIGVLVVLGAASIGLAFIPTLLAMVVALVATRPELALPPPARDAPAHP